MEKQRRVLLKLSGEALAGDKKTGFDEETVRRVAAQVKRSAEAGIQIAIVIGGGNFWRGRSSNAIDRVKADQIGMLATVMNCIYVSSLFQHLGMKTEVFSAFPIGGVTKLFTKEEAEEALTAGKIVFFAGGTGHPYFSTDTGVVLRAELADKLRLKYPLLPTISPCPTMRLEAIRSIIPISCRRYPKSV